MTLAFLSLVLGCEPTNITYVEEPELVVDAGPTGPDTDTGGSTDEEVKPDAEQTPTYPCIDNDHDDYCQTDKDGKVVDCNDSPLDADGEGIVDGSKFHPGALDVCDGLDNNCDTQVDEDAAVVQLYLDKDGDGYGIGDVLEVCTTEGYANIAGDCDDEDDTIHPFAADEPGDGVDADCDDETAPVDNDVFKLTTEATLTANFDGENKLIMTIQLAKSILDIFQWWNDELTVAEAWSDEISKTFTLTEDFHFVLVNVTVGGSNPEWLCTGSGEDAGMLDGASATLDLGSDLFEVLAPTFGKVWLHPDGGCAILFEVALKPKPAVD